MTEPDNAPEYLQLIKNRDRPTARPVLVNFPVASEQVASWARTALDNEIAQLAQTGQGGRNHQLNTAAFNLGQIVAGGGLDRNLVWTALYTTSLAIGLPHGETVATLNSGLAAGASSPRVPELANDSLVPNVTTFTPTLNPGEVQPDPEPHMTLRDLFPAIDWRELWADQTVDEWIVEPLIPARRLVALFSPPKVGKSLLLLELAVQISRGVTVMGMKPDRPRRVLYVDFENDPRGDVRTRLKAMGFQPDHLEDLVYLSFPRLAKLDTQQGGAELLAVCQEYDIEVVVIDTVSRAVGGEENSNDTWLSFYRNTGQHLKAAGIACVRLDHTGKDESKGMRGGSAKYGDVDAVWSMTRLNDTTYRLECTANRLPIMEKVLVVERRQDPRLHHALSLKGTGDVWRDEVAQIADWLAELGVPLPEANRYGRGHCMKALAEAQKPKPAQRKLDAAIKLRQERAGIVTLDVPGGDDD